MKKLKGTKTEQNLKEAFKGESEARNKYTYFASKAKKEGYIQISKIFEETAENEREHAKVWFKIIDKIGTTEENLRSAIKTEGYEAREMYPSFAKEAEAEGFDDIAKLFTEISEVEAEHEKRYKKLLSNIENQTVFKSEKDAEWICMNCGYVHKGKTAPKSCPACSHPQEYFALKSENY
ncbi:rubrerythrin family protein [bacterium]|nr:rubrerythrin family protein [bacterium]